MNLGHWNATAGFKEVQNGEGIHIAFFSPPIFQLPQSFASFSHNQSF